MLLRLSPEMIPLFTSTNCLQYVLLTLQIEWTNHCAYSKTKYHGFNLKADFKPK